MGEIDAPARLVAARVAAVRGPPEALIASGRSASAVPKAQVGSRPWPGNSSCGTICLTCEIPFTVYSNVALWPSAAKVSFAEPTSVRTLALGGNGSVLNGGPVKLETGPA